MAKKIGVEGTKWHRIEQDNCIVSSDDHEVLEMSLLVIFMPCILPQLLESNLVKVKHY